MDKDGGPGLFPMGDGEDSGNVVTLRGTGILAAQQIRAMIAAKEIVSPVEISEDQIQPASLDLRLGKRAYRVPASFLPGPENTVMDRVKQYGEPAAIDLSPPEGAVFERGAVYVVELLESVKLPGLTEGKANPKSSTGRLDILTRLITNHGTAFDRIERKYEGPLFVEVAPLTFDIRVRQGSRLIQARFQRGLEDQLRPQKLGEYYSSGKLVNVDGDRLDLWNSLVPVSVALRGDANDIVGYKAKASTRTIDIDRIAYYPPGEFWERILAKSGTLELEHNKFYILATREWVGVPPELAAEMVPYEPTSGEFRVHYAGFFDPGFGWQNGRAEGSKAVLEVRSYGVPFMLEHGQIVGWLRYSSILMTRPDKLYGEKLNSNYQGQGIALAKHFKPWPA